MYDKNKVDLNEYSFLNSYKKPLIVCGQIKYSESLNNIIDLSESIGAPIFTDPLSNLRYNIKHSNIITNYDHFLNNNNIEPDLIIRLGSKPISKILCSKLNQWNKNTLLISSIGRFNDNCPNVLIGDPNKILFNLISLLKKENNMQWISCIHKMDNDSKKFLNTKINQRKLNGANIANICLDALKQNDSIFIGNSLPIRDIDLYTFNKDININVFANRGASGIDGIISSALGVKNNLKKSSKLILLIGDLSFYHDMNGLLLAKRYGINITIVVENNNGGGIFKKLLLDINNKNFEEYWQTPTNLSTEKIAMLYNIEFYKTHSTSDLKQLLSNNNNNIQIVEAIIE